MRGARLAVVGAIALGAVAATPPARAEKIVISLSTHRIQIASNFTGTDVVLFGTVDQDGGSVGRAGGYAIVATVTGPRRTAVTWRKERVFGIWINASSRTFVEPPSFLSVLANRPFDTIASAEALRRYRVGLDRFPLPQAIRGDIGEIRVDDPFRQAFVNLRVEERLYRERSNGVTFITPSLFRAAIPLPTNVPTGDYEVDVKLFADGAMLANETTAFEVVKTGFEQMIAQSARDHSLLYGLATTALAFFTGWLGSILFRRD